ncbi:MAG: uridine kinase [Oscillospiraceae bacterium]|nr:uridine kinase [Oscillospiraceae bacterium]
MRLKTMVIGVAGGSGSGKTTISRRIQDEMGDNVSVIYYDNYYKAHNDMTYEQRAALNYDHPDAFDTDLFIEHIKALKNGQPVDCPVYDFTIHNRSAETVRIEPAKVLIVEGILIFHDPRILELLDIKIFVDTDADVRIIRRILRDVKKRGRSLESVTSQYLSTVKPMHEQFVEPSKRNADIVVLEGGHNLVALEMIMQRIRSHIAEN